MRSGVAPAATSRNLELGFQGAARWLPALHFDVEIVNRTAPDDGPPAGTRGRPAERLDVDPVTQGLLGGVAAHAACGRRLPRAAGLVGIAAGMAADLDVFIPAGDDPLGGVSLHRHFTHALSFVPVGGIITAMPFVFWPTFRGLRRWVFAAAIIAFATHGLLDACTAYGTVLLWPFSRRRIAWDLIGIIDPAYTLILLVGLLAGLVLGRRENGNASIPAWGHAQTVGGPGAPGKQRSPRFAAIALALSLAYLGLGAWQHSRAVGVQKTLARIRGHHMDRGRVMPTPGNLVVWRSIYETGGRMQADAVRVPIWGGITVQRGVSAPVLTMQQLAADRGGLSDAEREAFARFAWFADGYVAYAPGDDWRVSDWRYCIRPDARTSIWCLRLPPISNGTNGQAAEGRRHRWFGGGGHDRDRGRIPWLWSALMGRDPAFLPADGSLH